MGTYLKDRPWLTVLADKGDTMGECASCHGVMRENQSTLDDAYGVWRGECPHCGEINLLDFTKGLRGYNSNEMHLCLVTDHEVEMNKGWDDVKKTRPCDCDKCKSS